MSLRTQLVEQSLDSVGRVMAPKATGFPGRPRPQDSVGASVAVIAVVAVWLALVHLRPGAIFHFAPLLAAAAGPVAARLQAHQPLPTGPAAGIAAAAAGFVLTGGVALTRSGNLSGPTSWDQVNAPLEMAVFAGIGGLWGWRAATRRRPGLLFGHEARTG